MISMQSIAIIKNKPLMAALCAAMIATANVVSLKIVPDATGITIAGYILANSIAVPLAMWVGLGHHGHIKKKN
jgi:predicted MFS family arabinose efflux permease